MLDESSTAELAGDLFATVEGAQQVRVPGRATLTTKELSQVRDTLLNPEGAAPKGADPKIKAIADALRTFAQAYATALNAGGNIIRGIPSS
jgi:hypothetical protein